jgi:hypothetical protein
MAGSADPIAGPVLRITAAKASVGPGRVVPLIERVQQTLEERAAGVARRYEVAYERDGVAAYFVDRAFWEQLRTEEALGRSEIDAVRRSHNEQLRYAGRRLGRRAEFEASLEIRDCVHVRTGDQAQR